MKRGFIFGAVAASLVWILLLSLPIIMPKPMSRTLFSFLDVSTPPARADYIFVPSGSLFYRLPFAIALMRKNLGDTLVLTVTEPASWRKELRNLTDIDVTEGSLVLKLLRSHGVGESEVIFLGESRSSWQDAALFTRFLLEHPGTKAMVVSDGYHLRRLRLSFTRTDDQTEPRIAYAAASTFDDLLQRDTEYSDAYQLIFKECVKLAFYAMGKA